MAKNINILPSKNNENSFLFSTSLVFDENIDKLWLYLKDLSSETKNTEFLDNFKFIKGDNTWTAGNVFSLYWVGVSNIEFTCLSTSVSGMKKKIKWKCKCDIGISYIKTMILYRITYDDKTLVKFNFTRCEKNKLIDFHPQLNYYMELQFSILKLQSQRIQSLKNDKKIYHSFIINKNHIKVWNFITNLKNIEFLCPNLMKNTEYNGPYNEVGTFVKFLVIKLQKTCFMRVVEFSPQNKKTALKCRFQAVGTDVINIPLTIEIQVTFISKNKTYVSVFYAFESQINDESINSFGINLKCIINKIKEYIKENDAKFNDEEFNDG